MTARQNAHLTFKGNIGRARHDWLRLTPAYSYKLVAQGIAEADPSSTVLDPFSGTGTTGLVASEQGMRALLLDLNPFLIWLAGTKTHNYELTDLTVAREQLGKITEQTLVALRSASEFWVPPIHRVEKWWGEATLRALAALHSMLPAREAATPTANSLMWVAFCRVLIDSSNAAFNHQSMSFKAEKNTEAQPKLFPDEEPGHAIVNRFLREVDTVLDAAAEPLSGSVTVLNDDARRMESVTTGSVDILYTSPPYANRMSYIRELRPYMYWLGYLSHAREAGELDWSAIGGTWGVATSRVSAWKPSVTVPLGADFTMTLDAISQADAPNAHLLANYVHKYFADISEHIQAASRVMRDGGRVTYVVGNSTFYGTMVPTERWYAELLSGAGFHGTHIETIRKRNSKKELFEFAVHAVK